MKKYVVTLTVEERQQLEAMLMKGKAAARKLTHARILLKADQAFATPAWPDSQISTALEVDAGTVAHVRERFVLEGLLAALTGRSTRNHCRRRIDGAGEARLIAALCGPPPHGFARWSLRLLADKAVELTLLEEAQSYESIRQVLRANELKPWLKQEWCIPPEHSGAFVCQMEDILEVYQQPPNAQRPLVCMDELSYQLIAETRRPWPPQPGQPECYDYEYSREGVVNLFMVFAPLLGQRWVRVTQRRTSQDWAYLVRDIVDVWFPQRAAVVLVVDNLNTHVGGALYETFPPAEARRILKQVELHYTPKHGSWLNMAEIELSVLSRQCLAQRIGTQALLESEVAAWTEARNARPAIVDWQFTTEEARIKLKRLYPVLTSPEAPETLSLAAASDLPASLAVDPECA